MSWASVRRIAHFDQLNVRIYPPRLQFDELIQRLFDDPNAVVTMTNGKYYYLDGSINN